MVKQHERAARSKEKFPDMLKRLIDISDVILEVLDARFIKDMRNKEIEELIKKKGKRIIYVFNKSDLINVKEINKAELSDFYPYVFVSTKERKGGKELRNKIKIEAARVHTPQGYQRKQVGVIGYPNTGKSSIINLLTGKSSAKVGAEPGFTKGLQKLKLTSDILLLDSPGVIPDSAYSSTENKKISLHAKVGARDYNKVRDPELIIADLMKNYPNVLEKYYKIEANGDSEILLEELGKRKRIFKKHGEVNADLTARQILKEWQNGKIRV